MFSFDVLKVVAFKITFISQDVDFLSSFMYSFIQYKKVKDVRVKIYSFIAELVKTKLGRCRVEMLVALELWTNRDSAQAFIRAEQI